MPDFTVEFVAHSETEVTKEKRVTNRTRRARHFTPSEDCDYEVQPSGVLMVTRPVLDENGERCGKFEFEYFAQGEWIRVYDGVPKR